MELKMIVVTTPTGQVGRHVLGHLLDAEEPVRVIVRDPAGLPPDVRERVEIVQGSHGDPDVVAKAFAGADSVFWLVPPDVQAADVQGHYLDFTRPAAAALTNQRVVAVSTLGRGIAKNAGHLSAALAMDELIESTGVRYRSLSMPFFLENLLGQVAVIRDQGKFFLATPGNRMLRTVATRDIGARAARLLLDHSWGGQEDVPVVGPDELTPDGMASVLSEVLGRPVGFQEIATADYKAMLLQHGASEAWAQGLADMAVAQNETGVYDLDSYTPAPTSFRQWCEDTLKPALTNS